MNYLLIGGNSDIGKQIVKNLSKEGNSLFIVSREKPDYDIPGASFLKKDILKDDMPDDFLPENLDGLAYMPGTINLKPFRGLKDEDYLRDFEINFLGAVRSIRWALKSLKKGENPGIVLFSTVAVRTGMPFHSSISAAKGAVEGLTRSLAAEFAPAVRVNCIAPSLTDTKLAERLLSSEEKQKASAERHPLKKVGMTDDIANMATYLLSPNAAWITGQVIGVDGGMSTLKV